MQDAGGCARPAKHNIKILPLRKISARRAGNLQNFIAAPSSILLLRFQTPYKSHMKFDRMLPIKHKKEPLDKVLEAHLPADLMDH